MGCCQSNRVQDIQSEPIRTSNIKYPIKDNNGTTRSHQINDFEIWKKKIEILMGNSKLKKYVLSKSLRNVQTIDELVTHLKNAPTTNQTEKAWSVYLWVTDNIRYDFESFKYDRITYEQNIPENVLLNGMCVCDGYSRLFQQLCQQLGLECEKITGYAKSYGYKMGQAIHAANHAWNSVKVDNKWYPVESTWGAGCIINEHFSKKFNPYYFMTPAHIFLDDHYSEEHNITLEQFFQMPQLRINFHLSELRNLTFGTFFYEAETNPVFVEFGAPKQTSILVELKSEDGEKISDSVLIQRDAKTLNYGVFVFLPDIKRKYNMELYAMNSQKDETFSYAAGYLITRLGDSSLKFPNYQIKFEEYNLEFISPRSQLLDATERILKMEFSHPSTTEVIADLRDPNDKIIENAIFIQKNDMGNSELLVGLSNRHSKYYVNIFAKKDKSKEMYDYLTKFWITGTKKLKSNDLVNFTIVYKNDKLDFKLISPFNYNLKANKEYEFKYLIGNTSEVALVDSASNWTFLKLENNIWYYKNAFKTRGPLSLLAKPKNEQKFDYLCTYQIE
jgi:hypothetical protein